MYDELIKRLRSEAVYLPEKFSKNAELLDVLMKAADVIEELQAQNNELLFRCGQAEALIGYYQAGKLPSNAPPKEGNNGV